MKREEKRERERERERREEKGEKGGRGGPGGRAGDNGTLPPCGRGHPKEGQPASPRGACAAWHATGFAYREICRMCAWWATSPKNGNFSVLENASDLIK